MGKKVKHSCPAVPSRYNRYLVKQAHLGLAPTGGAGGWVDLITGKNPGGRWLAVIPGFRSVME